MALARIGRGTAILIGEETTWGTAVARTHAVRSVSSGLQQQVKKKPRPDLYGSTAGTRSKHFTESVEAGGPTEWLFGFEGQGPFWKHALWGTPTTTGPVSGIYTHTYPMAGGVPTGLTIEEIRGTDPTTNVSRVFEGCMIDSLDLELSAGGILTARAEIIAEAQAAEGTAGAATFTTNEVEALHSAAGAFIWNGVSNEVRRAKVSIKNNLGRRNNVGSNYTAQPQPTDFRMVEAEIDLETINAAFLTGLTADTEANATLTITGSGSRTMTLTLHNAYVDSVSDPIQGPDIIIQKVKLVGQFSSGSSFGFALAIGNTQSSAIAA